MDIKKIGKFLSEKRKSMGLTQQDVADCIGVSNKAISKWETGEGYPDISSIPELCRILEISADDFFAGETVSNRTNSYMPLDETTTVCSKACRRKQDTIYEKYVHPYVKYYISVGAIFPLLILFAYAMIGNNGDELLQVMYVFLVQPIVSVILAIKFTRANGMVFDMRSTASDLIAFSMLWSCLIGAGTLISFSMYLSGGADLLLIIIQMIGHVSMILLSGFLYTMFIKHSKYIIKLNIVKKESIEIEKPLQ